MEREYIERLVEVEQRCKSNSHRLDDLEENYTLLNNLCQSVAVIAEQTTATNNVVTELKKDVGDLKTAEISRKALEHSKNNFMSSVQGKLIYKTLEYFLVLVLGFIVLCIVFYFKSFVGA